MKYLALGKRLKALRERQNLSLEALSAATGIALDKLEKVEKDEDQPIIAELIRLAKALQVNVADIFRDRPTTQRYEIIRRGDRETIQPLLKPGSAKVLDYTYELLTTPEATKHMEAYIVELSPQQSQRPHDDLTHAGEEFMYILSGEIAAVIHGDSLRLTEGDALYFKSTDPHTFFNPGKTKAQALVVIYPY